MSRGDAPGRKPQVPRSRLGSLQHRRAKRLREPERGARGGGAKGFWEPLQGPIKSHNTPVRKEECSWPTVIEEMRTAGLNSEETEAQIFKITLRKLLLFNREEIPPRGQEN